MTALDDLYDECRELAGMLNDREKRIAELEAEIERLAARKAERKQMTNDYIYEEVFAQGYKAGYTHKDVTCWNTYKENHLLGTFNPIFIENLQPLFFEAYDYGSQGSTQDYEWGWMEYKLNQGWE